MHPGNLGEHKPTSWSCWWEQRDSHRTAPVRRGQEGFGGAQRPLLVRGQLDPGPRVGTGPEPDPGIWSLEQSGGAGGTPPVPILLRMRPEIPCSRIPLEFNSHGGCRQDTLLRIPREMQVGTPLLLITDPKGGGTPPPLEFHWNLLPLEAQVGSPCSRIPSESPSHGGAAGAPLPEAPGSPGPGEIPAGTAELERSEAELLKHTDSGGRGGGQFGGGFGVFPPGSAGMDGWSPSGVWRGGNGDQCSRGEEP